MLRLLRALTTTVNGLTTKVDALTTKVDGNTTKLNALATAQLTASPAVMLSYLNFPIVRNIPIDDPSKILRGAVIGLAAGYSDSTWTYVKRSDGNGQTVYFAMTCAHCALAFRREASTRNDEPTPHQFVEIPFALKDYVDRVLLVKDYYCFGSEYDKSQQRRYDIVVLQLTRLPPKVQTDEANILVWDNYVTTHYDEFHGAFVAGKSLKSPITGLNAVFMGTERRWLFMKDSFPEQGHSGTVMMCWTEEQGNVYITTGNPTEKERHKPRIMGLFTGVKQNKYENVPLQDRGSICPILAFDDFSPYEIQNSPASGPIRFVTKAKQSYACNWDATEQALRHPAGGDRPLVYGVFIDAECERNTRVAATTPSTPASNPRRGLFWSCRWGKLICDTTMLRRVRLGFLGH